MKAHPYPLLLLTLLLLNFQSLAQTQQRIDNILKLERTPLPKLETPPGNAVIYLQCPFSESGFSKNMPASTLQNYTVVKVYYVYTQYKQSAGFDQLALDRKRFDWLAANYEFLVNDPLIEWEIIMQTGCTDYTEGDTYFHGFVVIYQPEPTPEEREAELQRLTAYFENPTDVFYEPSVDPISNQLPSQKTNTSTNTNNTTTNTVKNQKATFKEGEYALYQHFQKNLVNSPNITPQRLDKWVNVSFTVNADGTVDSLIFKENYPEAAKDQVQNAFAKMPPWKPATENGKAVPSEVNLEIRISYSGEVKGMYSRDGVKPTFSDEPVIPVTEVATKTSKDINLMVNNSEPISVKSSAVYKGLELVRELQNTALVMDVTGSMTTHIAALVNWIKTNKLFAPFTSYTFFNDGDNQNTKQKKIGSTGGIYMTKELGEVEKVIKNAMLKGNGGEAPENDLEAVIHAFKNDENAHAVLLIGDNYSEVRDRELLQNISRPVHVLLCAAPKFVRCEYLQIAKQTGGMLLLNGEKIDLSPLQKGDKIIIQGIEYKYNGDSFEILYKGDIHY